MNKLLKIELLDNQKNINFEYKFDFENELASILEKVASILRKVASI